MGEFPQPGFDCGLDGLPGVFFVNQEKLTKFFDFPADKEVDEGAWEGGVCRESRGEFFNGRKGGEFTHEWIG